MPIFFPWLFHNFSMIKAFKIKDLLHASCHERDMYHNHEGRCNRPVLPLRTTHRVPVTVQEDVEDTKIWSDYINVSLYWNAGWKKEQRCFVRECLLISDFLWIFKTCCQFPWLFQAWKNKMELHDFSRFSMTGYTLLFKIYQDNHEICQICLG